VSNNPFVSIVIPAKNEESIIKRCIASLEHIDYPRDKLEVVIINDGSTDNTKNIVLNYNWKLNFNYIETDGVGVSKARDIGFKNATGDFIAFSDADCTLDSRWIKELLKPFKSNVAAVGGPNLTPEDDTKFSKCVGTVLSFLSKPGARYGFVEGDVMEIDHNPTCNVMYQKTVLEEVHGFNHKLITADDEELDYRIRKKGYKIMYTPEAKVDHYRRHNWKKFFKMAYNYGLGRMQAIKLHPKMGRWFHFAPSTFVLVIVSLLLLSFLNYLYFWAALIILVLSIGSIGVISLYFGSKSDCKFSTFFSLVNIWLWLYGIGMLRGVLK
jgi:cellulose synthase/poly-beta-1,6-N-acetylglucosamine synthase-like glycosyltransferase